MRPLLFFFSFSSISAFGGTGTASPIIVDLMKTAAPISKYIYGQFIEHLGRSVYGGLWAEMLEDRKFFFVVNDRYAPWWTTSDPDWNSGPYDYLRASPWKVVGPARTVTMDSARRYAGIHSPFVHLHGDPAGAGISQEGLALEKGRAYKGRIVLSADDEVSVTVRMAGDAGEPVELAVLRPGGQFKTYCFDFTSAVSDQNARLEIVGRGSGGFRIGAVSLMPADAVRGWRREVVELLKELRSPIYRWPGGNFVSGYDWRDGVGDRDTRAPRQNPAWKGVESNDVGLHEFMDLMELIGAEPYVCLNTGLGTVRNAADEVEYCVGSVDTPMGKLRGSNGHPEPFPVAWWAVGNEMYGQWQLGFMPLDEYVKKHNALADAIKRIDPSARLVGVGSVGAWDEGMLSGGSDRMDLISEHVYRKELPDVEAHSRQMADEIERIALAHRGYRRSIPALAGKDVRIAMDEWNYWYGDYLYGELGVQYHLKDALGIAMGLHAFFRNSDLFTMANYAQTVNVLGAIKTSRTEAAFDTTGLVLKLYRERFGSIPVSISGTAGKLDVQAALTEDGNALTVAVVNPEKSARALAFDIRPQTPGGKGTAWTLTGPNPSSANKPGKPPEVVVTQSSFSPKDKGLRVPALSVTVFRFDLK